MTGFAGWKNATGCLSGLSHVLRGGVRDCVYHAREVHLHPKRV